MSENVGNMDHIWGQIIWVHGKVFLLRMVNASYSSAIFSGGAEGYSLLSCVCVCVADMSKKGFMVLLTG